MARSIGKIKIKKLQAMVQKNYDITKSEFYMFNHQEFTNRMRKDIPSEWYDIWEMAYQEINRVVGDKLVKLMYN